jgi:hypothetical protein
MLKGIFGILIFIFFLFVFFMILLGGTILRAIKNFRKAAEQAAEQQDHRYRTETGRQRQQYSHRAQKSQGSWNSQNTQNNQNTQNHQSYQNAQRDDARRTETTTGETIIDHRHQERENNKIFDDSDGEYVEFEEA